MVFVDSGIWIDYFRGTQTLQTERLHEALLRERVMTGDIVLTEVLQGFESDREFAIAERIMDAVKIIRVVDKASAVAAARNYRQLRRLGITIRKTIDTLIATRCILDGYPLLYSDRDFDPFVEHLGLKSALA